MAPIRLQKTEMNQKISYFAGTCRLLYMYVFSFLCQLKGVWTVIHLRPIPDIQSIHSLLYSRNFSNMFAFEEKILKNAFPLTWFVCNYCTDWVGELRCIQGANKIDLSVRFSILSTFFQDRLVCSSRGQGQYYPCRLLLSDCCGLLRVCFNTLFAFSFLACGKYGMEGDLPIDWSIIRIIDLVMQHCM